MRLMCISGLLIQSQNRFKISSFSDKSVNMAAREYCILIERKK